MDTIWYWSSWHANVQECKLPECDCMDNKMACTGNNMNDEVENDNTLDTSDDEDNEKAED